MGILITNNLYRNIKVIEDATHEGTLWPTGKNRKRSSTATSGKKGKDYLKTMTTLKNIHRTKKATKSKTHRRSKTMLQTTMSNYFEQENPLKATRKATKK